MTPPAVEAVTLLPGVGAWFTGRPAGAPEGRPAGRAPAGDVPGTPPRAASAVGVGRPGNLSHLRPHIPAELARARSAACAAMGLEVGALHLMRQVHGARVGMVDAAVTGGAEVRGVDALVTAESGRALAVQVADCVPLLLASDTGPVAAVHVGRRGLAAGIVTAALDALHRLGAPPASLHAALGPAIGSCCYEVPAELRARVAASHPAAAATTVWGTPALDLPAAVTASLHAAGVARVLPPPGCTHCDRRQRWFSHRADPDTGRQLGVIVRHREGDAA